MKSIEQRSDELDKEMARFLTGYTRRKVVDFLFLIVISLIIGFGYIIVHKLDILIKLVK